jgi:hypothetical protein
MESQADQAAFVELLKGVKSLPKNTMIVLPVGNLDLKSTEGALKATSAENNVFTPESLWKEVCVIVYRDIEMAFAPQKWRFAKPLAGFILESNLFCISANGKFFWIRPPNVHPPQHNQHNRQDLYKKKKKTRKKKKKNPGQADGGGGARAEHYGKSRSSIVNLNTCGSGMSENVIKVNFIDFLYTVTRAAAFNERMKPEWRHYKQIVNIVREKGASRFHLKNQMVC